MGTRTTIQEFEGASGVKICRGGILLKTDFFLCFIRILLVNHKTAVCEKKMAKEKCHQVVMKHMKKKLLIENCFQWLLAVETRSVMLVFSYFLVFGLDNTMNNNNPLPPLGRPQTSVKS